MPFGLDPASLVQTTSLKNQADKLFSGASQTFDRVAGGISSAVQGLAAGLGIAGLDPASAVRSSVAQLSGIAPVSKFTDSLINTNRVEDLSPQETKPDESKLIPLQYPQDITNRFIKFTFAAFYQPGPLFKREIIPQRSIILPIPSDLVERYGVQYQEKQLGVLGILQESGVLQGLGQSDMSEGSVKAMGTKMGEIVKNPGNAAAVARNAIGMISDSAGSAFDRATGTILNPYSALQFTGIELRSHSFKYKFSPNNRAESKVIKDIIKEFKLRMLPEKTGLLFNFPDVCTIEFADSNKALYFFKNCYLKSMNVNYAPAGTPAFFVKAGGGDDPVEVELSLEFGEIEPVTRNDVIKGKFTGAPGQAMETGNSKNYADSGMVAGQ